MNKECKGIYVFFGISVMWHSNSTFETVATDQHNTFYKVITSLLSVITSFLTEQKELTTPRDYRSNASKVTAKPSTFAPNVALGACDRKSGSEAM